MIEQKKIHTIQTSEMIKKKSVQKWIQDCFKSMEKY